jgi:hypothetical protein
MPISLAASSQTQIGSSPFSNFRQRLSQSIIGTKQLKVEATNSGAPFFIHTRNLAGCSPSSVQEAGLRICLLHRPVAARLLCERRLLGYVHAGRKSKDVAFAWEEWAQLRVQMDREHCAAVSKQNFGAQNHSPSRFAQCYAHFPPDPSLLVLVRYKGISPREITRRFSCCGLPEPPDQKLQLIDSI